MTSVNIDVVNSAIDTVFTNTLDNDVAICSSSSNQMIHLGFGTGSASMLKITNSNLEFNARLEAQQVLPLNNQLSNFCVKKQYYSSATSEYAASTITAGTTTVDAVSISFTPLATGGRTSRVVCQCFHRWYAQGTSTDSFEIFLYDGANNQLDYQAPTYSTTPGADAREPPRPMMGVVVTTGTSPITFKLSSRRTGGDDASVVELGQTKFIVQQIVV